MDTAVTRIVNSQAKLKWSNVMLDDIIVIICSIEQFKNILIFRNQKCAANLNIFKKVVEEMNEKAAADGPKNRITHSQIKNKIKGTVMQII